MNAWIKLWGKTFMNDYQQKRLTGYVLPQPVYRQALWAVKDMERLKERLAETKKNAYAVSERDYFGYSSAGAGRLSDKTGISAVELTVLSQRINASERAFAMIPDEYRDAIADKLMRGIPYPDYAHSNTWKKWQQILVYHVAVNLQLL